MTLEANQAREHIQHRQSVNIVGALALVVGCGRGRLEENQEAANHPCHSEFEDKTLRRQESQIHFAA